MRRLARARVGGVRACAAMLALGCVIGALFFLRPTISELERRELTAFPELTAESFWSGSFFSELSLWYGDTYPLREPLVAVGQAMRRLYGVEPQTQLVGGNVAADELPVDDARTDAAESASQEEEGDEPVEVPTAEVMAAEIQNNIMQGLYVKDGAAYSIYYFSQESVERYARAMNTCAASLGDDATVYSIVVPNNSGALLDEATLKDLGGTDQRQAIRYFYSLYDEGVHGVNVYDTLREHNDDYIYFRSDHHWTQLGAYYAYLELCKERGVRPSNILQREKMRFEPFLGTFYAELGNAEMAANPDYVDAYVPNSTNDLTYWDTSGVEHAANVITDVTGWNQNSLYGTFIVGDRPLTRIDNPDIDDGSACLVVKDSYGCAFVPLLVDDYQTTWVIDFRYSSRNIPDFVRENKIDDVIFLNNMSLAGTDPVSNALLAQVQ